MPSPEPFIASQQFLLLDPVDSPEFFLDPERFRDARYLRYAEKVAKQQKAEVPQTPFSMPQIDGDQVDQWWKRWQPISRHQLFNDESIQRLCVTIDGGTGKTTALRWVRAFAAPVGGMAVYINLRDCRELSDAYELRSKTNAGRPTEAAEELFLNCLIRHARNIEHVRIDSSKIDDPSLGEHLMRLLNKGKLLLLCDGLDQTAANLKDQSINPVVAGLHDLLTGLARNCRAIVAGRPHAVKRYWPLLFSHSHWRFAQIDGFRDEKQRRAFLGDRFAALENLEADELQIPRLLAAARRLPIEVLQQTTTVSELYCHLLDYLWEQDLIADKSSFRDKRSIFRLLGALAFQMFCEGRRGGVERGEFDSFLTRFLESFRPRLGIANETALNDALVSLAECNSAIDYCLLDSDGTIVDIYFRDTTLQEFFAAYWLVTNGDKAECEWFGQYPFLRPHDTLSDETLYRVWKFAVEMPDAPAMKWLQVVGELYRPDPVLGRRSGEMLYRSWFKLRDLAFTKKNGPFAAPEQAEAERILRDFHSEFSESILGGHAGPVALQTAQRFLEGFRTIPPDYRGPSDLRFISGLTETQQKHDAVRTWGDEQSREVQLRRAFELSESPTTNAQYRLFEKKHESYGSDSAEHPVDCTDWYCAKVYAIWLNPYSKIASGFEYDLPHELEWEFAARCRTNTIHFFCDDNLDQEQMFSLLREYAEIDEPTAVMQRQPNPWQLYDMLGLVWEWVDNPYTDDPRKTLGDHQRNRTSRVARGGSWYSTPASVRSSVRHDSHPSYLDFIIGFRVARALL